MSRRVLISVTQNDINKGIREDSQSCPIARAATRALGAQAYADIQLDYFDADGHQHSAALPDSAHDFIQTFDLGEEVKPFVFAIEIEDE